jgi:octaprenyl-diphosphate synthase
MHAPATAPAALPPRAELTQLRQLVQSDLARVNQLILEQGKSDISLINDVASHIIAAGGKRLRPCLTIAAAKLCSYTGDRHIRLAACVEFIHTATLLHDDVVDDSDLRRGAATANSVWGNQSSVLVGDFLFSRAFQLMVADGSLDVLKILSDASAIIAAGEVHQLMVSHDMEITQAVYEEVVAAKTSVLFAAACELGAVVSGQPQWRAPLRAYGHALGMAFQLVDDALDYHASEAELGKAIGDDFRDGKVTLPVIIAYANASEPERQFWRNALESGEAISPADLQRAKQFLASHQAFDKTLRIAESFAQTARDALATFPASPAKDAMLEAADFAVGRSY